MSRSSSYCLLPILKNGGVRKYYKKAQESQQLHPGMKTFTYTFSTCECHHNPHSRYILESNNMTNVLPCDVSHFSDEILPWTSQLCFWDCPPQAWIKISNKDIIYMLHVHPIHIPFLTSTPKKTHRNPLASPFSVNLFQVYIRACDYDWGEVSLIQFSQRLLTSIFLPFFPLALWAVHGIDPRNPMWNHFFSNFCPNETHHVKEIS